MADLTPEGLEQIERLAKAATPGERKVELDCFHEHHISVTVGTPPDYDFFVDLETSVAPNSAEAFNIANQSQQWKDAAFIAAANPETVLALVARVRELEAERKVQSEVIEEIIAECQQYQRWTLDMPDELRHKVIAACEDNLKRTVERRALDGAKGGNVAS